MPLVDLCLVPGSLQVLSVKETNHFYVKAKSVYIQSCPRCLSKNLRTKSSQVRHLKHSRMGSRLVYLDLETKKYLCKDCGKYFHSRIPGILPRKRATESFRQEVFESHEAGITKKRLSETHKISSATVESWYQDFIGYRIKEMSSRKCPMILGIDEHFFTKKQGYATTLVDLKNNKVFDVVLGRTESNLGAYLAKLEHKDRVKVVVMDLSENYRRIIKKYFPNALIVSDRFHVVRLMNHHFLHAWKQFDPEGRKNRGLLSLMRRHAWNLSWEQKRKLALYLKSHPALEAVYNFKQNMMPLFLEKSLSKKAVKKRIPKFLEIIRALKDSPLEPMKTLGNTMESWMEEIARMWRFRKTNSITEGLHNKMEVISRRAYGFRNFNNYRMRVLALCGWNGVFNRV